MNVKRHNTNNQRNHSSKPWILFLFSLLILIYLLSLGEFLVQPPSKNFSNGLYVDTVDYGAIKNMRTAVVCEVSDEGISTLVAIDGHRTKIIQLDNKGHVILSKHFQLDLYGAKELTLKVTSASTITLFYIDQELHQVNLDIITNHYYDKVIAEQIDSYLFKNNIMCIEEEATLKIVQFKSEDFAVDKEWLNLPVSFVPLLVPQDTTQTTTRDTTIEVSNEGY